MLLGLIFIAPGYHDGIWGVSWRLVGNPVGRSICANPWTVFSIGFIFR